MKKKMLAFLMSVLIVVGIFPVTAMADEKVAKIGETEYTTLAKAVEAAQEGETVKIIQAGTYTLPDGLSGFTILGGVEGVILDGSTNPSHWSNMTIKNVTVSFGQDNYRGFQHNSNLRFEECVFTGLHFSYGNETYCKCTFNQTIGEYNMWMYGTTVTYEECTFNCQGKCINVYNEGNVSTLKAIFKKCHFNSTAKNKSAVNVKETCGTTILKCDVSFEDCVIDTPDFFPTNKNGGSMLWMVDDLAPDEQGETVVTVDGVKVWEKGAKVVPPSVVIGEGEDAKDTEVIVEQKSAVDETEVEKVVSDESTKTAITENTKVTGVELTTVAEEGKTSGLQAVVNAAIKENTELAEAIKTAETVNVEVKVSVVPTQFVAPVEATQETPEQVGTVTFELKPTAIVTVGTGKDAKSGTVPVANSMIDTTKPITVSFYTGFEPAKIVHTGDDDFEEVFRKTGDKTFSYNNGVCTLKIKHFSKLTALSEDYAAEITRDSVTTKYATLAEAVTEATAGQTVTLLENVTIDSQLNIDEAITLDGNGKKITRTPGGKTAAEKAGILVTAGATIKNLTVSGPNTNPSGWDEGEFGIKFFNASGATLDGVTVKNANAGIQVNGGSVTMKNNITVSGNEFGGIELCHGGELNLSAAKLVNDGETDANPVLWNDDTKGKITFNEAQALYIRAADAKKDHYYLDGEAKINKTNYRTLADAVAAATAGQTVTLLENVTIDSQLNIDEAITLDGNGKTITRTPGGADATYKAGILVTAGATIKNLTVSGPNATASAWDDGEFGIKLYQANSATLEGVTVTGANAGIQVNGGNVTMTGKITLTGNEFGGIELCHGGVLNLSAAKLVNDGETDANPVLWNDDTKGKITFNEAQALYIRAADAKKDHYYLDGEAKINKTNYRTLADAIAAVKDNEIITMVADVNNAAGISVPSGKNFTVDFDGHTYSTEKPGAGSTNTETQAFQLLKNSTITFKNGTIQCAEENESATSDDGKNPIKRIIQNYANLTLENMVIDGTYLNGKNSVIEFANGTVNITGNTSIKAKSGVDAITVDTWRGSYPNGAKVTINTTGTIGDIYAYAEGTGTMTKNSSLTIQGGTFGTVSDDSSNEYTISISGGTFSSDPKAYLAEGYFSSKNADGKWVVEKMEKVVVKPAVVVGDSIKVGTEVVTVEGAGNEGQPTKQKAADAITETLYTEAFLNYEDPNIAEAVTGNGTVKMSIVPTAATVEVDNSGVVIITEMTFEVHPVDEAGHKINNNRIRKPITFHLPVDRNITAKSVAVYHEGVLMGTYPVLGNGIDGKYIEIALNSFSKVSYRALDEKTAVAKITGRHGESYFATLAEAVDAVRSGETITVLNETDEDITVERKVSFKLVVKDGARFTGSINAGKGYKRYIENGNYVFKVKTSTVVEIGGNKDKEKKPEERKEENPETGAPVMNMGVLAVLAVAYVATRKH